MQNDISAQENYVESVRSRVTVASYPGCLLVRMRSMLRKQPGGTAKKWPKQPRYEAKLGPELADLLHK
jgi:hypothetical protein